MGAALRAFAALVSGAIFGLGLALSGMMDPVRVRGFLDPLGAWDPTLGFVMAGAVPLAFIGVRLAKRMDKPALAERFFTPLVQTVDRRLVFGSVLFGIGWGIGGLCPGPALAGLMLGLVPVFVFVAAMIAGMLLHDRLVAGNK